MTVAQECAVLPLQGHIVHNSWGSHTSLYELLGVAPSGKPAAELWFGTHHMAPSLVGIGESRIPLGDLTGPLPYLLKVLAAEQPLSLQVHPSREQARDGYLRDQKARIALDAPHRRYRDENHKPELLVALTPFRAMAGFRHPYATAQLVDELALPELTEAFQPVLVDVNAGGVQAVLSRLLSMSPGDARGLVRATVETCRGLLDRPVSGKAIRAAELVLTLDRHHPADIGVVASLLLNDITLRPGQALFVPAGAVHAYVQGTGVEVMACSDNVLRGALTTKHVDVAEFLRVVDPVPAAPMVLEPVKAGQPPTGWLKAWPTPVIDFAVLEARCSGTLTIPQHGVHLLLCIEGGAYVGREGGEMVHLRQGQAAVALSGPTVIRGRGHFFAVSTGAC